MVEIPAMEDVTRGNEESKTPVKSSLHGLTQSLYILLMQNPLQVR